MEAEVKIKVEKKMGRLGDWVLGTGSPEQLPRRGNIIVENKANKENVPELLVLISVTDVSSGASIRHQIQEAKR